MDKYCFLTESDERVWLDKATRLDGYGSVLNNIDVIKKKLLDTNKSSIVKVLNRCEHITNNTLFINRVFENCFSSSEISKRSIKDFRGLLLTEAFRVDDVAILDELCVKVEEKYRFGELKGFSGIGIALTNKSYATFRYITSFSGLGEVFNSSGTNNEILSRAVKAGDVGLIAYLLDGNINKGYVREVHKGKHSVFKSLENNFDVHIMDLLYEHIKYKSAFYDYLSATDFEYNNVRAYMSNRLLLESVKKVSTPSKTFKI